LHSSSKCLEALTQFVQYLPIMRYVRKTHTFDLQNRKFVIWTACVLLAVKSDDGFLLNIEYMFRFPIVSFLQISLAQCVQECQMRSSCNHLSYYRNIPVCVLDVSTEAHDDAKVTSTRVISWSKHLNVRVKYLGSFNFT